MIEKRFPGRVPWPSLGDAYELVILASLWLPAWLLPERAWHWMSSAFAFLRISLRRNHFSQMRSEIDRPLRMLGAISSATAVQRGLVAGKFEEYFFTLREYAPWGWHPKIRVTGIEHLHEVLASKTGAILYVHPSVYSSLIWKKGLAAVGVRVTHLSRSTHGLSPTEFGVRFLNPIVTRIEDRYIAERLTLDDGSATRGLRPLIKALREKKIVSITANAEGRTVQLPFLGGTIRLARGAAGLSLSSGAPILPVMVSREGFARYHLQILPRLQSDARDGGECSETELLKDYVRRLHEFAHLHPDQCTEWVNRARWQPSACEGA